MAGWFHGKAMKEAGQREKVEVITQMKDREDERVVLIQIKNKLCNWELFIKNERPACHASKSGEQKDCLMGEKILKWS